MFYIVLLILLGILFLVAELVLLPGVSVALLLSLACYGGAIYLSFADYGTTVGSIVVAAVLVVSLVATLLSLRAKTWRRLSLNQQIDSTSMSMPEAELKAGDCGVSVSRLSPMGKVNIGGKSYEAKSEDAYIDPKCEVEVTGFENFTVIVRKK